MPKNVPCHSFPLVWSSWGYLVVTLGCCHKIVQSFVIPYSGSIKGSKGYEIKSGMRFWWASNHFTYLPLESHLLSESGDQSTFGIMLFELKYWITIFCISSEMFFALCVTAMRICLFPLISLFQHICYLSFQIVFLSLLKWKVATLIVYLFSKV